MAQSDWNSKFISSDTECIYYGTSTESREVIIDNLRNSKLVTVDIETISLKDRTPLGVGFCYSPNDSIYFPLAPIPSRLIPWDILENPEVKKVFHNAPFDIGGLQPFPVDTNNIGDTLIMASLLGLPLQLAMLGACFGVECYNAGEWLKSNGYKSMLQAPLDKIALKCCQDARATYVAYQEMIGSVNIEYLQGELEIIPILLKMSRRGIKLDHEVRESIEKQLTSRVEYYLKLCEGMGFNPASPHQVAYILAKRGNKLPMTESYKSLSSDEDTLKKLNDPVAGLVLAYREDSYTLSHYIKPLRGQNRIYTQFHMEATTGRISSTKRNLQNIPPGRVRNMMIPDSGVFDDTDYSQIELRVLAYLSQDKEMLGIYERGEDIHQATADFMNIRRKIAKNVNFSMIYGGSIETIANTAEIQDMARAAELRELWFKKYDGAYDWILTQQQKGLQDGYVETLFGRRIRIEEDNRGGIERKAVNYPIQGTAAEIVKRAMRQCKDLPLILQIHDELIADGEVDWPDGLDNIAPFRTPRERKLLARWE